MVKLIQTEPDKDAGFVEISFDVKKMYGTLGRVKIKETINGIAYLCSIVPMGGSDIFGILKAI